MHLHTVDFAGLSDSLLSKQNYSCKYNIWSTEKELFYFLYSETFVYTLPINIALNSIFKLPHSLPWLFLFVKLVFSAEQLQLWFFFRTADLFATLISILEWMIKWKNFYRWFLRVNLIIIKRWRFNPGLMLCITGLIR